MLHHVALAGHVHLCLFVYYNIILIFHNCPETYSISDNGNFTKDGKPVLGQKSILLVQKEVTSNEHEKI